jgi:serine/threonine-protein kinase
LVQGTPFGRYRLVTLLGRGGMGEVWRAHDTETDRVVAIKLLPPDLSGDEEFQQRFRREAHAAARLNDPHVIPIHNYGEIDGQLYVDMRLIEGRDLQTVLADGPLDPVRAVLVIDQVAKALHAAHEVGLLHRDIKPSNILLDRNDFAYLIDFGIARAIEETRMTKSGDTIGTFQYIAPERLDTGTEDARADIYSLACVLYESLTGHPPFPGSSTAQLINAHLNAPPPRPSTTQPDVPPQVDDVIATGMAKDPDQRYATTVELATAAHNAITTPITRTAQSPSTPAAFATIPASPLPATESAALQQSDDLNRAATKQGTADSALPENTTPPRAPRWSPRGRSVLIAAITAAVLAAVFIIFQLRQPSQPASPAAQTAPPSGLTSAGPPPPPPVTEAALDGLLLTPAQIDTTMGANGMVVVRPWSTFNDLGFNNPASPPECISVSGAAEAAAYNGSGWTAVRGQSLQDKDTSGKHRYLHWIEQAVIMFPSAQAASAFVSASTQSWPACANRGFHDNVDNAQWNAGQVTTTNGTLTAIATATPSTGWACQRALTARNNVVIDATGCSFSTTEQGISIANQIATKVPTQ